MSLMARAYPAFGLSLLSGWMVVSLAACNAGPELRIDQAPVGAVAMSGVTLLTDEVDERAVRAVRQALEARQNGEGAGAWQVVTALAVRPVTVGTFTDETATEGEWAETPRISGARREPGLHVLTLVATRDDGSDRRVVRVSGRGPVGETPDALLTELARLATDALIDGATVQ